MRNAREVERELARHRHPLPPAARLPGADPARSGGGVPHELGSLVQEILEQPGPELRRSCLDRHAPRLNPLFAALDEPGWRHLAEALLPAVAPAAHATLAALVRRPYQAGLTRRPFRAPRSPETLAALRGRWLLHTAALVADYDGDAAWLAAWAPHLCACGGQDEVGWLLAGALDAGDDAVLEVLRACAAGEHPVGRFGRHAVRALLSCSRPEGWDLVERLLLAAQRQEGLRQVILESADEAHPEAFRRILGLIGEHDLARFSAVVRAADMWLGFRWEAAAGGRIEAVLERLAALLDAPAAREDALRGDDPEGVYLALWSLAFADVEDAVGRAAGLLDAPADEVRFAAVHLLVQAGWSAALPPLAGALRDPHLPVAARALDAFVEDATPHVDGPALFEALESLLRRATAPVAVEPVVWPWTGRTLERGEVAAALAANASAVRVERMLPHVRELPPAHRRRFVARLAAHGAGSPRAAAMLRDLLGDASPAVRGAAFAALSGAPPGREEAARLVELLARRPGDLRTAALGRLGSLPEPELLDAAGRLTDDVHPLRRRAGLELLRHAAEAGSVAAAQRLRRYAALRAPLPPAEQAQVDAALGGHAAGLLPAGGAREWPRPRARGVQTETPGAAGAVESLAALLLLHAGAEVRCGDGERRLLLEGTLQGPRAAPGAEAPPLAAVWRAWLADRGASARDPDGLELFRALVAPAAGPVWTGPQARRAGAGAGRAALAALLEWAAFWQDPPGAAAFLADGLEDALAAPAPAEREDGGGEGAAATWHRRLRWWRTLRPEAVRGEPAARVHALLRGLRERSRGDAPPHPDVGDFLAAAGRHGPDAQDFIHLLLGPGSERGCAPPLRAVSTRPPPPELAAHPALVEAVETCRRRVVAAECLRGDRPGPASAHALNLRWSGGLETLAGALPALGAAPFSRRTADQARAPSRQDTLSHLVLRSWPRPDDTPVAFATWARESRCGVRRLVELAMYAPQWAGHVEHALAWPGLESGVWWFVAHARDDRSPGLRDLGEAWGAGLPGRTTLAADDRREGAVDAGWFREAYGRLGPARWEWLEQASRYASGAGGHERARLFGRALAGRITAGDLASRVRGSRHRDAVLALGLPALPAEPGARRRELLDRFAVWQQFLHAGRRHGGRRRQGDARAVEVGLENLARAADVGDARRLRWSLEREAVADLAGAPLVRAAAGTVLELSIGVEGVPRLSASRDGVPLASVPRAVRREPGARALRERLGELRRQAARIRRTLEEEMCRGHAFSGAELRERMDNPLARPALERLVLLGDAAAGYPVEAGLALRDAAGRLHPVGADEPLRLAHPTDFFARADGEAWQRECFRAERVQPFKQLFRELYPLLESERGAAVSRRYAGHQVQPRRALALLGGRGWVAHPAEGLSRTFHDARLTARLAFLEPFHTPADVEGLTLESLRFTAKGDWRDLPLAAVAPRLFSEVMRDLDLVVAVAHQGGVDPEATASTLEMRAALLRETCELLGLVHVRVEGNHARIRGEWASYAVHLGSAAATLLPGTSLVITALHAQHRGRIFLPFADADPRTAEVLSKVLLLARDREIRDPALLAQIGAAHPVLPLT